MRTCSRCGYGSEHGGVCASCRIKAQAIARSNAATRRANAEIDAGNRRRTRCLESIIEWCMKGDLVRARIWLMKLASAGFAPKDIEEMQAMDIERLEATCRVTLGVPDRAQIGGP